MQLRARRAMRRRRDFRCSLTDVNFGGDTFQGLIVAGIWGSRQTTVYVRRIRLTGLDAERVGYATFTASKLRAAGTTPDLVVDRFRVDRFHGAPTADVVGVWTTPTQTPVGTTIACRRVLVQDTLAPGIGGVTVDFVFSRAVTLYSQTQGVGVILPETDAASLTASFDFEWSER